MLGSAALAACLLAGFSSGGDPSPAAQPTLFGALSETALKIKNGPDGGSAGARKVAEALDAALESARQRPESERDQAVLREILKVNEAARNVGSGDAPAAAAARIHDAMAALNNDAGRFEDAADFAGRALAADPKDAAAYVNRSLAEYGRRRYLDALEDARKALAIDPNDRTAFFILKLAEGKVPAQTAEGLKSKLGVELQSEYQSMEQQLTEADQKRRELAAAAPAADRAGGPTVSALVARAARKLELKDYAGAIADADAVLTVDPSNTAAYYYLATAHNLSGDYESAALDAGRALAINPHDAAAHDTRAWALNHLGRFHDAIADSNHSLEINPQNAYAFANLGYAHEQMGDVPAMLQDLRTAAALNAQFEPAYHDAAARHGLEPEISPAQLPRQAQRRRSFSLILITSVVGGFLIALGIVQWMGEAPWSAGRTEKAPAALQAAYTIGRTAGLGGMGVVFEAYDRLLQRKVAIKRIRDEFKGEPRARERLLQEARTVAALHHPAIIDIHSIVEDSSGLYLVFEFLEGQTAADWLVRKGPMRFADCRRLFRPVCEGLEFAHRRLIVHRDLKPNNIMITSAGDVKILDFGISKPAKAASGEGADQHTGTPQYMAPEQELGVVRRESDVYSLAACFYEMLTGRQAFPMSGTSKLALDYLRPHRLDPRIPAGVDALLDEALQPDPEKRIPSAAEFWRRLEAIPA